MTLPVAGDPRGSDGGRTGRGAAGPVLPGFESVPDPPAPPPADPLVDWLEAQARNRLETGRIDEAIPMLERLLTLTRDGARAREARLALGEACERRDEWGRAVAHYRCAVELDPASAEAHYRLGVAHSHVENARAATEALRRAAELEPDDAEIARALGVALAAAGQDGEADSWLRRAAELAPDAVDVLEALAAHQVRMGRFAECGELIRRATAIEPDNPLVRRLAKETSYLVERAASAAVSGDAPEPAPRTLRIVLPGAAGETERLIARSMTSAGFLPEQVARARDAWRDYVAERSPRKRNAAEHAAAIEYLIARLDFVDGCSREEVAGRHGVEPAALARVHEDIVEALAIDMFDARYCSQPHPARHVGEEAEASGLMADEVFEALLEDEYREYCAAQDRSTGVERLDRDEFEDASVEYGSLLTRELMGLRLTRRERRRRRELERILLVL